MNLKEITKAHGLYLCGMSLSKVGLKFNTSRQMMHHYFKTVGLEMRKQKKLEFKTYNNLRYTIERDGAYRCTTGDRGLLHTHKWINENGPMTKGMQIYHIDRNKANNEINNLRMMTISDIVKLNGFGNNQFTKGNQDKYNYNNSRECFGCDDHIKIINAKTNNQLFCTKTCNALFRKNKPRWYSPKTIYKIACGKI